MNKLVFPGEETILEWGKLLLESHFPDEYLPLITNQWARATADSVEVASLHPCKNDLVESASRIFYKIIKNHRLVDGNKRSALVVTYLFLVLNNHRFKIDSSSVYELARMVAQEKEYHERTIQRLVNVFVSTIESIE
jgi:death-on-curing family protein